MPQDNMMSKIVGIAIALFIIAVLLPVAIEPLTSMEEEYTAENLVSNETLAAADGTETSFSETTEKTSILEESVKVTAVIDGKEETYDTYDSEVEVTNESDGSIDLDFDTAPDDESDIIVDYTYETEEEYNSALVTLLKVFLPIMAVISVAVWFVNDIEL